MDLGLGVLEEVEERAGDEEGREIRVKRERDRSMDRGGSGGMVVKGEGEEEEDVLGRLLGRDGGMTPEARERKRRKVGIKVL
ncbi:MAG: hypothetical protein Q9216_006325 [Gyalolechia sp. 2 TL-2023]